MQQRVVWVDYAKAIGIILVVYGHVARGLYHAGIGIPTYLYSIVDTVIYSFHMPLFFFLSGLFFYKSLKKQGGKNLISSKVDTLIYPYLVWTILQGSLEAFLSDYTNGKVTYQEVLSLLWSPIAQFWFLYALFFVYLFATILFSISSKRLVLPVLLLSILLYLYPHALPDLLIFKFISHYFIYFTLGIVFSLNFTGDEISKYWVVFISAFAFVISQSICLVYGLNSSIANLILSIIGILFVISLSAWTSKFNFKIMILVGSASLTIYLMHILVTSGMRIFLVHSLGIHSVASHLLFGCFAGIFLPVLAYMLIEKYKIPYILSAPINHWSASISKKISRV